MVNILNFLRIFIYSPKIQPRCLLLEVQNHIKVLCIKAWYRMEDKQDTMMFTTQGLTREWLVTLAFYILILFF